MTGDVVVGTDAAGGASEVGALGAATCAGAGAGGVEATAGAGGLAAAAETFLGGDTVTCGGCSAGSGLSGAGLLDAAFAGNEGRVLGSTMEGREIGVGAGCACTRMAVLRAGCCADGGGVSLTEPAPASQDERLESRSGMCEQAAVAPATAKAASRRLEKRVGERIPQCPDRANQNAQVGRTTLAGIG
jgi:hypothetical protein